MKPNKTILTKGIPAMLALALVLSTMPSADAAYWNRNRNRRGSATDNGTKSSSSSPDDSSTSKSRGRDLDGDGIPNSVDPDIDNDGIPNSEDRNVDGGIARSGPYRGRYIGDRLPNNHPAERDIDDDGLLDHSAAEHDIDGDGIPNAIDNDVDGDGIPNATDADDDGDGIPDATDPTPRGDDGGVVGGGQVGNGLAPAALAGFAYALTDSDGLPDYTLNFMSATTGDETFGADVTSFTYVFTPSGATATLRLRYKVDKWDDYELNYATGTFIRREFDKNALKDTDAGSFSIAGSNPGTTGGGTSVNGGVAPVAISGANWVVKQQDGAVEANLIFTSATAGSENDPDGDIDPFTYVYSTNGTTASLRLDFKPGKWDEYDLDFATGGYIRREFKNNSLDDTDSGTFGLQVP